jgi:glycosyltransferase involved in cell wall biosynthesis
MRIAFVTACLEPGRDGVGDYARNLAAACVHAGHEAALLALNDRYVERPVEGMQAARCVEIDSLRLPAASSWSSRSSRASAWLERRAPDWISLQFVPYGFHRKGFVFGLGVRLAPLVAGRRVQMMFHEIWTGDGGRWRERLVGRLQRLAVRHLVDGLEPELVHTSNSRYRALLAASGIDATVLPLFGNIPVCPAAHPDWLSRELANAGVAESFASSRHECWRFGMLGSLYPVWSPEPLLSGIAEAAARAGRRVTIASIGRLGPGEQMFAQMAARYAGRFSFAALGERSPEEISTFLQSIDFGIATTPWSLIGKSGTAAAMLDHGVPVVVTRNDGSTVDGAVPDPLLYPLDRNLPRWLLEARGRPPHDRLPDIAQRFLRELTLASVGQRRADSRAALPVSSPRRIL